MRDRRCKCIGVEIFSTHFSPTLGTLRSPVMQDTKPISLASERVQCTEKTALGTNHAKRKTFPHVHVHSAKNHSACTCMLQSAPLHVEKFRPISISFEPSIESHMPILTGKCQRLLWLEVLRRTAADTSHCNALFPFRFSISLSIFLTSHSTLIPLTCAG
jgi:hypothetical protein